MEIRRAESVDAESISRLANELAAGFTLEPDGRGAEPFFRTITPAAIRGYVVSPACAYFKAVADGALAGVVAIRDNEHLYHLFVRPADQGRGVGRRLWEHAAADARARGNPGRFTVHSTPRAVPVYERFGFRTTGPRVEVHGIAYVPMRLGPAADGADRAGRDAAGDPRRPLME